MFTDIVTSTDLVGLIGDDDWNELLGWHDRELRSAFAEHRGEVVNTTGDGFFVALTERPRRSNARSTSSAASCVTAASTDSPAPSVRIGLHRADGDATGVAITPAVACTSRHGSEPRAGRDEILATAAALQDLDSAKITVSEHRQITLKGVREAVEIRSVNWR